MIKSSTEPELCLHSLFSSTLVLQKDSDYQRVDDSELKSKVCPRVPLRCSLEAPFPPCCPWKAAEGAAPGQRWGRSPDCWSHLPPESGHTPSPPTQGWGREDRSDTKGEVGGERAITEENIRLVCNIESFFVWTQPTFICHLSSLVPSLPSSLYPLQGPTHSQWFQPQPEGYI